MRRLDHVLSHGRRGTLRSLERIAHAEAAIELIESGADVVVYEIWPSTLVFRNPDYPRGVRPRLLGGDGAREERGRIAHARDQPGTLHLTVENAGEMIP